MKKALLVGVSLAAIGVAPAFAADLAPRTYTKAPPMAAPIYSWAGFYLGLNGGGASSHKCWDLTGMSLAAGAPITPISPAVSEGCHDATGGLVGGQIGYRWQASNWVFGLEAQGDWASLTGSNPVTDTVFGPGITDKAKVDAIGLFTGQVGYAWNNLLWYVKGGAALTHDKYSGIVTGTGLVLDQASETRWGGAVGTGIEFGFAPNWSVAFEYDHLFMGRRNVTFTTTPLFLSILSRTDSIKQDVDMATVRVNYTFGGPVVAKY